MQSICYTAPNTFEVKTFPVPQVGNDQVLVKVSCCGVCGSDRHVVEGSVSFVIWPVVPGHEVVGKIVKAGKDATGFSEGDRVVIDPTTRCDKCFFCLRGESDQCIRESILGVSAPGGFSEYVLVPAKKAFKIHNITDEEATLIEPTSCAIHLIDKLQLKVGSEVLVLGAGPSGIMISQLCKLSGASRVVLASNKGMKMDVAKQVGAAHEYLELDRNGAEEQWKEFREANPLGFDAVIEATGSVDMANDAINHVRRGGTLGLYGLYSEGSVNWSPLHILANEIKIVGAIGQNGAFPRAVEYVDGGKINVKGVVTHVFNHSQFQEAMDKLNSKQVMKIAIKP